MVSIVGTPTLRRPFRRPSDARGGDWSEYAVYCVAVAPLAQRLEQRPFKSWVVGSNPTGGTCEKSRKSMFSTVSETFLFLQSNGSNGPIQHLFNTFTATGIADSMSFHDLPKRILRPSNSIRNSTRSSFDMRADVNSVVWGTLDIFEQTFVFWGILGNSPLYTVGERTKRHYG